MKTFEVIVFGNFTGMACLHGYKVQSSVNANIRKFAFELIPPDLSFRYFYFYTDTEMDKKRYSRPIQLFSYLRHEIRWFFTWMFLFFSDG